LLRGQVDFTLPRHVFVPQVRELILGAIREHEFVVRPEYASVLINGFNDSGIQIT
jgi:small-conductance mechanosensitive channel